MRFLIGAALLACAVGRAPAAPPRGTTGTAAKPGDAGASKSVPKSPTAALAPTAPPPASAGNASGVSSTYRVSPGDILDIYVWGDERLQRSLSVLPDGTFSFPLAGTLQVAGKTSNQIESELSRLLAPQYKDVPPQVTVSVKQSSGMQIAVIGKVRSPGNISPNHYITVLDAIAQVGGPSDFADVNHITVLRNVDGKITVLKTKIGPVLKGKRLASEDLGGDSNPELRSGDTVVVP